ncbi:S41 family peptidase [uncultured Bacteroides sp.]|uniref:S41 family peptidase n=1 Tax=uncultured Bacteroides sp. TaxID=162156 RepID=UPI002600A68A|nr:S41 family peptidase [uncultured Bacteroides sp.]
MKKIILLFLLSLFLVETSYSQEIVPVYSLAQVTEDFDYYINTLKTNHPNLYAFVSEDYFNKEVEKARSMLTDSMNIVDLWRTMLRLQHCLDGHSGMDYIDLKNSFPLVYGDAFYLYPDSITYNEIFMNGMKVISINGMEAQKIIHELDKCIWAEENPKLRLCHLRGYFPSLTYSVLKLAPPYKVVYQGENGEEIVKTEIGIQDSFTDFNKAFTGIPFDYKLYPEESIAYLEVNSFSLPGLAEDGLIETFQKTLDTLFVEKKINDYKYLFIDISKNTGGDDRAGEAIFGKLKHDSVAIPLVLDKDSGYCVYPHVPTGYSGLVFVIAGHWTYSAAHTFYLLMRNSHRGIFVGEPPGHYRQVYAPLVRYKMPNTKLPFQCARSSYIYFEETTPDIPWSIDCFHEAFTLDDLKKMIELYNNKKQ